VVAAAREIADGEVVFVGMRLPLLAFGLAKRTHAPSAIGLFENGLVRAKGEQVDVIRWDAVAFVIQNVRRRGYYYAVGGVLAASLANRNGTPHGVTVQRNDGVIFKFNNTVQHVAQLIQTIQTAVLQAHMPRAMAAYNAGSPVTFGPLTLGLQGLSNGRELLPWNEVQSVDIKRGQIIVKRVGKTFSWANINIAKIPNVLVFMSMINYARTGRPY